MFHLSDFLAKYKNLGLSERLSKEAFVYGVNEVLGKQFLKKDDVSIKNKIAYIKIPSLLKSEILVKKEGIFLKAKEMAGQAFQIEDIR